MKGSAKMNQQRLAQHTKTMLHAQHDGVEVPFLEAAQLRVRSN